MTGQWADNRQVLSLSGADAFKFLQDTITNDLSAAKDGMIYAAILSPQGKYLFDFFVSSREDKYLIDIASDRADALAKRLMMYKLRADVMIEDATLFVNCGVGDLPKGAFFDPRNRALGWRMYGPEKGVVDGPDWTAIRVEHSIPETGIELIADETYILEAGFERINGVDFRKGCYVGQEVTARMKHKTELRKGFVTVNFNGSVPMGTEIIRDGKAIGRVFSQSGCLAIAYLRFDRAGEGMQADGIAVTLRS